MRRQQLKDKAEVDSGAHPSGESVPGFPVDGRLTLRAPTLFSGGSTVGSYAVLTVLPFKKIDDHFRSVALTALTLLLFLISAVLFLTAATT